MGHSGDATEGMRGGGYYDSHSEYQRAVAESGAELIKRCVAATPLPDEGESYVVADYGCSTGANSIKAVTWAAEAVRARNANVPVAVLHNDVPTNDFNQLFANLRNAPHSYVELHPPALPLASAASFFGPAAPERSVHLGMSFSAAHWLSSQPQVVVPRSFYFADAVGDARRALEYQAAEDWRSFLRARSCELVAGGRLFVQMIGTTDDGQVTASKLMRAMAEVAEGMVADGTLGQDAVDRYLLPVYARTAAEARRPLVDDAELSAALSVEEIRVDRVANPYLEMWRADGDGAVYGTSYAAFVRGFTESSLRLHLLSSDTLVDDYFKRLEARFAGDPEADVFEDWTLTVVLARS